MTKHNQKYGGILSVTEILQIANISEFFYPNEEAKKRGSYIHKACELDDMDNLDETSIKDEYRPYLEQWRQWKELTGAKMELIELPLISEKYNFAGTIDRVAIMNNERFIIDIKTGGLYDATAIQLAGYKILYQEHFPEEQVKRMAVLLNPRSSSAKVVVYENDKEDEEIFHAARIIAQWKEKK